MQRTLKYRQIIERFTNRFTTVPLIGVDLGSAMVKVAELEECDGRLVLRRCKLAAVEQDPVQGLKRILSESGIRNHYAVVGVASPEVIARSFHFPPMPNRELTNAVRLEAEQAVLNGHTLDEMAIDWHLLSFSAKESIQGLLAVVPKTVIASRIKTVKAAGLNPMILDVEGLALWNAYWVLVGSREPASKTILLVNIGASKTNLVIARGPDELILARDLEIGSKALTGSAKEDWAAEVSDSLAYARSKGGMRSLDLVCVTGGGSQDPEILALLKSVVTAPIHLWNPLDQLEWDSKELKLEKTAGPLLTLALGLALRRLS